MLLRSLTATTTSFDGENVEVIKIECVDTSLVSFTQPMQNWHVNMNVQTWQNNPVLKCIEWTNEHSNSIFQDNWMWQRIASTFTMFCISMNWIYFLHAFLLFLFSNICLIYTSLNIGLTSTTTFLNKAQDLNENTLWSYVPHLVLFYL